jgi:hypothetical protein
MTSGNKYIIRGKLNLTCANIMARMHMSCQAQLEVLSAQHCIEY